MSYWGVFENLEHEQHVMPSSDDGRILNDHTASRHCWCVPVQEKDAVLVWVHNDRELGGFNS